MKYTTIGFLLLKNMSGIAASRPMTKTMVSIFVNIEMFGSTNKTPQMVAKPVIRIM